MWDINNILYSLTRLGLRKCASGTLLSRFVLWYLHVTKACILQDLLLRCLAKMLQEVVISDLILKVASKCYKQRYHWKCKVSTIYTYIIMELVAWFRDQSNFFQDKAKQNHWLPKLHCKPRYSNIFSRSLTENGNPTHLTSSCVSLQLQPAVQPAVQPFK